MAFYGGALYISSSGHGEIFNKIWSYMTDDSLETTLVAGYFPTTMAFNRGDFIAVASMYASEPDFNPAWVVVTSISPQIVVAELPAGTIPVGAISTAMLQDGCVTNEKVATGISGTKLAPLSIPAGTLEAASIATDDIELLAITDALIDTVSGAKIIAATIPSGAYTAGSIIGTDISPNTITETELGSLTGWVTSPRIANGAVGTVDIADAAVTNAKLGASRLLEVIPEATTAAASDVFTVAGALVGDFSVAQFAPGSTVSVVGSLVGAGTVTVNYSGVASAGENINIFLFRNGT